MPFFHGFSGNASIAATELDNNTQLVQYNEEYSYYDTTAHFRSNIFAARDSLQGLRIRLDGASTVVGYKAIEISGGATVLDNNRSSQGGGIVTDTYSDFVVSADGIKKGTDGYTFENGILTITVAARAFAFSCRPQGTNCRWQNYTLFSTLPTTSKSINTTNVVGGTVSTVKDIDDGVIDKDYDYGSIVIPKNVKVYGRANSVSIVHPARLIDKLVFTVRAGTAASLKYTSTDDYAVAQVRGKTTITKDTITVAADAKPTDSVNTKYIKVIVEE